MRKNKLIFLFVLLITTLAGCNFQNVVFYSKADFDKNGWGMNDAISFPVEISNTTSMNNVFINVRQTNNYALQNIILFVKIISPEKKYILDTIDFDLADDAGKWRGKGSSGIYLNEVLYKENVKFPLKGEYIIQLQQGMRYEYLQGITDISLKIIENK